MMTTFGHRRLRCEDESEVASIQGPATPVRRSSRWGAGRTTIGTLSLLFTVALAGAATAQIPPDSAQAVGTRVTGKVLDAGTGAPVDRAFLTLSPTSRRTLSDSVGRFVLPDVPPGLYRMEIQHIGYADRMVEFEVQGRGTTHVEVRLTTQPIALEPLRVEVDYRPRYLERQGFYERMEQGAGTFFDPAWVERWNVGIVNGDDFLERIKQFAPSFSPIAKLFSASCSGPLVYVDGVRDPAGSASLLSELAAHEIGAVETYPGFYGVPDFVDYEASKCGAIAIWTRRWETAAERQRRREGRPIDLCVPRLGEGEITVEGLVRDEFTDVLLPGATVRAVVRENGSPAGERQTTADHDGWYRFCDLPADAEISLHVRVAHYQGTSHPVAEDAPTVRRRDLEIRIAGPGRVAGRVVDAESDRPVAGATVGVRGSGLTALTDAQGHFMLEEVAPGDHVIEFAHLGFETLADTVSVLADRTIDVRAELSIDPIELEPMVVTTVRSRRLEVRGFYERRRWSERTGRAAFFSEGEIERRRPVRVSQLIADVPGVRLDCSGGRGCAVVSGTLPACGELSVYIDGTVVIRTGESTGNPRPMRIDDFVHPSDVAGVEVYTGPASLPAEFSGSTGRCGAVVIWTK